jgi:hypothetical protein
MVDEKIKRELDERLVKGDIDIKEYDEILKRLEEEDSSFSGQTDTTQEEISKEKPKAKSKSLIKMQNLALALLMIIGFIIYLKFSNSHENQKGKEPSAISKNIPNRQSDKIPSLNDKVTSIQCNTYKHYAQDETLFKICPKKYKEIILDMKYDKDEIDMIVYPAKNNVLLTKDKIITYAKAYRQYIDLNQTEWDNTMKMLDNMYINNSIRTIHYQFSSKDKTYIKNRKYFVIEYKYFPHNLIDEIKKSENDFMNMWGALVSGDTHFTISENKGKSSKIYVSKNKDFIFDSSTNTYYAMNDYGFCVDDVCSADTFKVKFELFPHPKVFIYSNKYIDITKYYITEYNKFIKNFTIHEKKHYGEIDFFDGLSKDNIEKIVDTDYFVYK